MVLGTDGGVAADVADNAAADLPRPRLGRRGRCEQDGEGEAQQEELPPAREGRGHGCDRIGLVGGMKPSRAVDSLPRLLQMRSPLPWGRCSAKVEPRKDP